MKGLLLAGLVFLGFGLLTPQEAQAQCGKCIVTSWNPYQAYCQRGPLAPPAQKDCIDLPDGSCWENSEPCYLTFSVSDLKLTWFGKVQADPVSTIEIGDAVLMRSCQGLVVATSVKRHRLDSALATTESLII